MQKKRLYLLLGAIIIVMLIIFTLTQITKKGDGISSDTTIKNTDASEESTDTEETDIEDAPDASEYLDGVNPEDNYPIIRQAGIPYEDDQFAIMFMEDADAPHGVIFYGIDKSSDEDMSPGVRTAVISYLTGHGVDVSAIEIQYMGLKKWKSIQGF